MVDEVVVVVGSGSGTDEVVLVVVVVVSVTTASSPDRPRTNPIVTAATSTNTTAAPVRRFFTEEGCMRRGYRAPLRAQVALGATPRDTANVPTDDRRTT